MGDTSGEPGARQHEIVQERAQRTRAHILDVAARAFAQGGYAGTALNDVIRASGLTKGAFYFHFPSKDALALATFRMKQEELITRLQKEAGEQPTALRQLAALLRLRAQLFSQDPSLRCVLRLGAELGAHAEPGSAYAAFQETALALLTAVLVRGQEEGSIRSELPPRATAETIFAAIFGLDELSQMLAARTDLAARTEALLAVLLPGLAAGVSTHG
ncbi:MAG TPA: TetR/AcrR family transcriptional regulator [Dehalococcoidia bacterium]|nr:TetR/AcrR family transcriptional regulator [Dehalococcoidia bacterium]